MLKNLFRKKEETDPEEQLAQWEKSGRPLPPPHIVKQRTIEELRRKLQIEIFVETGTFLGDMVEAQRNNFQKIYSIELSEKLFKRAEKRFRKYPHIKLLQGDSGVELNRVMIEIDRPALFWLDGHYSEGITAKGIKECPVPEELDAIFKSPFPHIILIDDARLFNGTRDYPTTDEIKELIKRSGKNYSLEIEDDIIRLITSTIQHV